MTGDSHSRLEPLQQQAAPLRNKIIAALRNAIETGLLQPGARLVERDLCDQLNVSRTSVREALRELQAEGILTQTPNRGLTVEVITPEEAANIYKLRAVIESLLVEQFIERAGDLDIKLLSADGAALKAAYQSGDVKQILIFKRLFYDRICSVAGNAPGFEILNRLILRTSSLRSLSLGRTQRQAQSVKEITAIVQAISKRDTAAAKAAATLHVESAALSALHPEAGSLPKAAIRKPKKASA